MTGRPWSEWTRGERVYISALLAILAMTPIVAMTLGIISRF